MGSKRGRRNQPPLHSCHLCGGNIISDLVVRQEYDRVTDAFRNLLVREASKGTRAMRFAIVNPDRQFNQGADIGRYSDVLQHMLRGKNGEAPGTLPQPQPIITRVRCSFPSSGHSPLRSPCAWWSIMKITGRGWISKVPCFSLASKSWCRQRPCVNWCLSPSFCCRDGKR